MSDPNSFMPSGLANADDKASAEWILEQFGNSRASHEVQRQAVLDAEVVDFGPEQALSLAPVLRAFIERHRDSGVPADMAAVGSAVRKFIAIASLDEAFDFAAELIEGAGDPRRQLNLATIRGHSRMHEGKRPLARTIHVELEICKMVVRKLTANPPTGCQQHSPLARRLRDLAKTYLNPRLLAREKRGAIALNATLGLVLMGGPLASEVVERVRALDAPWFQQVVARQAAALAAEIRARSDHNELASVIQRLEELSEHSPSVSPL